MSLATRERLRGIRFKANLRRWMRHGIALVPARLQPVAAVLDRPAKPPTCQSPGRHPDGRGMQPPTTNCTNKHRSQTAASGQSTLPSPVNAVAAKASSIAVCGQFSIAADTRF